jgi:hypothetical protein
MKSNRKFYGIQSNNFKTSVSSVNQFSLSNNETYLSISLHSRRKSIVFYSRITAITRSDELRHSLAARDTKHPHEQCTKYLLDHNVSIEVGRLLIAYI